MSQSPVLLPSAAWPSKAAAAARLGCSVRTLERYIDEKKLAVRLQPVAGRKPLVLVDPAGVEAMLNAGRPLAGDSTALQPPGESLPQFLTELARAIAGRPAPLKPWLTLDEAAEYSGLPRAWLLAQARGGLAIALNVGAGKRASWRFSRDGLKALRVPVAVLRS